MPTAIGPRGAGVTSTVVLQVVEEEGNKANNIF